MSSTVVTRPSAASGGALGWTSQRRVAVAAVAALAWAAAHAGLGQAIVNGNGWSSFARFWTSVARPELAGEFLRLTLDAAAVTLSYAVLGSVLSLAIGAIGAIALSEVMVGRGVVWRIVRVVFVVPRAVHEILWALLFVQVLGFNPLAAILAIGIPFGAVTAKVFAETIDESDRAPFNALRAAGASRLTSLAYGVLPVVRGELLAYSFYRFECAIRSAAVLGVIGAGGLGFQLDLSFETLRYGEIWTLIAALMLLSGGAEAWATAVRRSQAPNMGRLTGVAVGLLVPLAVWWAELDLSIVWASRTWELGRQLIERMFPTRLGLGGWSELISASVDTVAMSVLATALASVVGLGLAALTVRSARSGSRRTSWTSLPGRGVLLLFRAVPAPIWAFLFVLILFPGLWPGAVGLAIYNIGVLGRLYGEALDEADPRPASALAAAGASPTQSFFYGLLPTVGPRLVSLTLYRWEVIVRETVVVGVVGAGGLGQLINEHLAARDFAAVTGAIGALIVIALAIDVISATTRRALR